MKEPVYYAALSANDHIGPHRFAKILEYFPDLSGFFALSASEQMEFLGVRNPRAEASFRSMLAEGERIVAECGRKGVRMVAIGDPDYPSRLRAIPDAPFLFYQLGELNHSVPCVAVVGTRDPSPDSAAINEFFSRELVNCGIGIVSGLAKGHDGIAQKIAVEDGGYTVAVLGCGIDIPYPREFTNLYRAIAQKCAVISEYPPGKEPMPWYFPLRNRIISGLSDAVLLVQAPEKSGALITADYAAKQGKDVYVVPGNPTDHRYAGSNRLIRYGCKLALKPEDIVLDILGGKPVRRTVPEKRGGPDADPEETKLISLLATETYIDDLANQSGMSLSRLNLLLTRMELKGMITQYPGRFYVRNN
jgi:DNA processing protein